MVTQAAMRSLRADGGQVGVATRLDLRRGGFTPDAIKAHLAARRWQSVGRAVVLTTRELTRAQQRVVALINCGPTAALTGLTAAETFGLTGWERAEIHVVASSGARVHAAPGLPVVVHRVRHWSTVDLHPTGRRVRLGAALVTAAGDCGAARPACALFAAAVQQRLLRPDALRVALAAAPRVRHRRLLAAAIEDIEMGAGALSEIDFLRLCRRHRLPLPRLQQVRCGPGGRRRYLDAEWVRSDGRRVVTEVDGAIHLQPLNWIADQLRQNEIALANSIVLRFPAVVVRTDEAAVAGQLRRALAV